MAGKQAPCGRAAADSTNRPPPCVAAMSEAICRNLHLTEQAYKVDKMQRWRRCRMHSNSLMVLIITVSLLTKMSFSMTACRQANFAFPSKPHVNSLELQEPMPPHGVGPSLSRICNLCWQPSGCAMYSRSIKTTSKTQKTAQSSHNSGKKDMLLKLFLNQTNLWEEASPLQVYGGLDTLQPLQHG